MSLGYQYLPGTLTHPDSWAGPPFLPKKSSQQSFTDFSILRRAELSLVLSYKASSDNFIAAGVLF